MTEGMQSLFGSEQSGATVQVAYPFVSKTTRAQVPDHPNVVCAVADVRCGGAQNNVGQQDDSSDCFFCREGERARRKAEGRARS